MARTTYVAKAQVSKRNRVCRTCHKPIEVGTPYKWFSSRIGRSSRRSDYHAQCDIPRSHRTSSAQLQTLYDGLDSAEKALESIDGIEDAVDIVNAAAEAVREAAEMYRESQQNIEDGFGHATSTSDEIGEKADELESFADELEGWSPDADEFDEDEAREEVLAENDGADPPLDEGAIEYEVTGKRDEWLDTIRSEANDALSNSPF